MGESNVTRKINKIFPFFIIKNSQKCPIIYTNALLGESIVVRKQNKILPNYYKREAQNALIFASTLN